MAIVDRVQWFRARAHMEHWEEEFETVEEEFRRTIRGFDRMAEVWTQLAEMAVVGAQAGHAEYAFEKAWMYGDMATDCRRKFTAAGGGWPEGCTLSEYIFHQRQLRQKEYVF
jgi:hypothetical protein